MLEEKYMSLIHCPECGKEISDKSEKCIHCGYPIRQSGIYETIDNKEYELNFLKDNALSKFDKIKQIKETTNCDVKTAKYIADKYCPSPQTDYYNNIPKCPTCGSTNIRPISGTERAVSVIGLGLFSKKINKTYKCLNCKHTW